ncbi:casein kinase 2 beta 2 subunit [Niveomyces insectorum RCEF 264]|uniref:Casein kinase 2 beta 2 subunit n=1 Tax=Niveomyces insectorum RCEF 264 TaxID=1081102 RepID=A0A162KB43_9HYPO|nr:casein kinase 2 beta 2 subunit [Niveomyces insectorum RCEF 264]
MASAGGIWVPMAQRALRQALASGAKMTKVLRNHVAVAARSELEPTTVRSTLSHAHRSGHTAQHSSRATRGHARARRGGSDLAAVQTVLRRFFSVSATAGRGHAGSAAPRYADRVAFLQSTVGANAVWRSAGRAPFASTLRPNLTGGALPRTAGGYTFGAGGKGARYFSHTPAAPAQVVQNVSQAMRAFWEAGRRARFNGTDARGRPQYKAISALEEDLARKLAVPALPKMAPGAFVDFPLNPTITALSPLAAAAAFAAAAASSATGSSNYGTNYGNAKVTTLGTEGFLDVLSVDFARALKELSAIMNDLKRLAALGDLPVLLEDNMALRVRFPGVDAETVDRLCEDLGITRGVVGQDPGFDLAMGTYAALRFPYAPDAEAAQTLTSPGGSLRSHQSSKFSDSDEDLDAFAEHDDYAAYFEGLHDTNPWLSMPSHSGDEEGYASLSPPMPSSGDHVSQDFEGLEGVYRFLEECDRNTGRFGIGA